MPGVTIGWEYLTGYAVATDPSNRARAEWPPHPGRLFMALAAAWFETDPLDAGDPAPSPERRSWAEEGEALRWLETLGDPELRLPRREDVFERSSVTVYVPVNDKAGPSSATLQSAPSLTRSRQPRAFPCVFVGDHCCFMTWSNAEGAEHHRVALARLCAKVTRIGHSSSLVRVWASSEDVPEPAKELWERDELLGELQSRVVSGGTLDMLAERFNASGRQQHATVSDQIEALEAQKQPLKGKDAKARSAAVDAELKPLMRQRESIDDRPPLRPTLSQWSGYRRAGPVADKDSPHTVFDTDILVLTQTGGPRLPLESTLMLTRALRATIMSGGAQPVPSWVSGHELNGEPLRTGDGHLALMPLPFVGGQHADGHLMGMGLVFPRAVDRRERGRVLGNVLLDRETRQPHNLNLKLGRVGVWTATKKDWTESRSTLRAETWTAHPRGADTWASVTPVVLDRFPKADRLTDRPAWTREVVDLVIAACTRVGLPPPMDVDIDTTSWHRGSPRAVVKRRSLRGVASAAEVGDGSLGDGFPPFPHKGTAPRPQVHVWLRFATGVLGPVLLGAGRYLGYGLCKPLAESRR